MDIQAYIQSGIIESYVLGIADAGESAELEQLAAQYPEVQQAINDFSDMLEQQALQNAVAPPAGLKQKILDSIREDGVKQLATTFATTTDGQSSTTPQQKSRVVSMDTRTQKSGIWRYLAAASVILFMASAAYNVYLYNQYSESREQYQALLVQKNSLQANNEIYQTQLKDWQTAAGMMADPTIAMIKMPGVTGKENSMATVFWDTKSKDVYVVANKLPAPAASKQYQLWAIVDGKPVDAGMIDPSCTSMCKMKTIPNAQAFAITLENAGGSQVPTMDQMYVMGKV